MRNNQVPESFARRSERIAARLQIGNAIRTRRVGKRWAEEACVFLTKLERHARDRGTRRVQNAAVEGPRGDLRKQWRGDQQKRAEKFHIVPRDANSSRESIA